MRKILLALAILVVVSFFYIIYKNDIINPSWFYSHFGEKKISSAVQFVLLASCFIALGFPRQFLCFVSGYLYGFLWGLLCALLSSVVACSITYFAVRFLGREFIVEKLGTRLKKVEYFLRKHPFTMAISIRIMPIGSNWITNLAAGLLGIPPLAFIGGSALGFIPQTTVFALLGSGVKIGSTAQIIISIIFFFCAFSLGYFLLSRHKKKNSQFVN